jgi:hypothetical protein
MNFNPMQLMSMLMNGNVPNNFTKDIIGEVSKKLIQTMYKELDADDATKKILFIKDPRHSEKVEALTTLATKSIPNVLNKMNESDVTMLYNILQSCKD